MKVLVVEDSYVAREIICNQLKKIPKLEVIAMETSTESWQAIVESIVESNPFDLVVMDLNMPDFDGIDLIFKLREEEAAKGMNIIVVTADSDIQTREKLLSLGVADYFVKPFDKKDFIKKVKKALK